MMSSLISKFFVSIGGLIGLAVTIQFFPEVNNEFNRGTSTLVYFLFLVLGLLSGALLGLIFKSWFNRKSNFLRNLFKHRS